MAEKTVRKKYPIFVYLSYLVILGIFLSGVSLARYTAATSGNVSAALSRFACSFSISDASSLTFSNTDYWLVLNEGSAGEEGTVTATNTARTVRFSVRNYVPAADGSADRVSDLPLQATLRFAAPAEFAGKLAVQVLEVQSAGAYTAVTPQFVLKDFLYDDTGAFRNWGENGSFNTAASANYNDSTEGLPGAIDWQMSVSGGFTGNEGGHTGTVTATCPAQGEGSAAQLKISAETRRASYSVGFARTKKGTGAIGAAGGTDEPAPVLYIDCEKEVPFYTVDIALPQMYLSGRDAGGNIEAQERTFVLFITSVARNQEDDFGIPWQDEVTGATLDGLLDGSVKTLNGAAVTGYHFTREVPLYNLPAAGGTPAATGGTTTVNIVKTFGKGGHGSSLRFEHVAPVQEGLASVGHGLAAFWSAADGTYAPYGGENFDGTFASAAAVNGLYGVCSNPDANKQSCMYFGDFTDDPYYDTATQKDADAEGTARLYEMANSLSKGFTTSLTVVFAQAGEAPAAEGGRA